MHGQQNMKKIKIKKDASIFLYLFIFIMFCALLHYNLL